MILVADRLWDGAADRPIDRGFVSVQDGTIDAVGRAADLPSDARFEDLGDATILPGLINAHVHVTFSASTTVLDDYFRERDAEMLMQRAVDNLGRAADAGVTTVRDLGTLNDIVFAARAGVRDGSIRGPDIVAAGEGITSPGGHCYFFGIEVQGTDAVRAAVRRQSDAGADCIKIFATGGALTPNTDPYAPQYTVDELRAAVDEARGCGLPIASHAHATEGIRRSVAARVDTIEHCGFHGPDGVEFDEETAEEMAAAGVVAVPTPGINVLRLLSDPSAFDEFPEERRPFMRRFLASIEEGMANFERMRAMGVTIIAGTDAGISNRPFGDFPRDLSVLASREPGLGMGTHGALVAATSGAARGLGLADRGELRAGWRADILAVDGDPLQRIVDLQRTRLVMCGGRIAVGGTP